MRSEGKRFSATRRILTARSATSGAKPSRTSVLKISVVEQPRCTLCATHSCHSCGKSVRAIRNGQRRTLRVLSQGPVRQDRQSSAHQLRNHERRHVRQPYAGKRRAEAARQGDGGVGGGGGSGEPVRRGDGAG